MGEQGSVRIPKDGHRSEEGMRSRDAMASASPGSRSKQPSPPTHPVMRLHAFMNLHHCMKESVPLKHPPGAGRLVSFYLYHMELFETSMENVLPAYGLQNVSGIVVNIRKGSDVIFSNKIFIMFSPAERFLIPFVLVTPPPHAHLPASHLGPCDAGRLPLTFGRRHCRCVSASQVLRRRLPRLADSCRPAALVAETAEPEAEIVNTRCA